MSKSVVYVGVDVGKSEVVEAVTGRQPRGKQACLHRFELHCPGRCVELGE